LWEKKRRKPYAFNEEFIKISALRVKMPACVAFGAAIWNSLPLHVKNATSG